MSAVTAMQKIRALGDLLTEQQDGFSGDVSSEKGPGKEELGAFKELERKATLGSQRVRPDGAT